MVYSDYVKNNMILPKKAKYTMQDYKKLVKAGYTPLQARFSCICSAIYYYYDIDCSADHISYKIMSADFAEKCRLETEKAKYAEV